MKLLDALLPVREEQRYSWTQWMADALAYGPAAALRTTWGTNPTEPIADNFPSYVAGGLRGDSIVSTVELIRFSVFAEARFQFQRMESGRPGALFGTPALSILETPWPGATTGDLLARMLLMADLAGNAYVARLGDQLVCLRPDWTDIILSPRLTPHGEGRRQVHVGYERLGYVYWEDGEGAGKDPAVFLADEVCHFAPYPDPLAVYRGMSWLTPVLREIQGDVAASAHKLRFFENAATPNLAISLPKEISPKVFDEFMERMDARHKGMQNAYETLYLGGGADVTPIGANLQQIDFKVTQGAGETRIANAAGVPAVLAGLSEGLQGSSLNAGNYASAKRRFADGTVRPLWRNVAGSLQSIVPAPVGARLWWDGRDVAFLRDDEQDLAEIQHKRAQTIRTLTDAGYTPESVVAAVEAEDMTLLRHSGLYSVQLQKPGTPAAPAA